ncbi:MAG: DUF6464 family protein [Cyanobacteria bacterium P01_A01_bin.123]
MITVLMIFAVGFSPAIASWLISRRNDRQTQTQITLAMEAATRRRFSTIVTRLPNSQMIEGVGTIVGDISCEFNARSPYLRCAINPCGPCDGCRHYRSRKLI